MDESHPTCNKRFTKWDIPQTEETRRAYREWLIITPGLGEFISGGATAFLGRGDADRGEAFADGREAFVSREEALSRAT